MSGPTPLSEGNIIRYKIMHPDKDIRPFAKRLHRYAASSSLANSDAESEDGQSHERDMIRLEMIKWKLSVERMMGSARNLERQRETYIKRTEQTVSKTDELRQTLEEEKVLLATRRRERDRMIKCDEVAAKLTARGKNKQDLDERIATLQQSLEEHKAALKLYQETAEGRVQIFNQISDLLKNCRELKLPIDPNATVPIEEEAEKIDVDEKASTTTVGASSTSMTSTAMSKSTSNTASKLSSMSLPFQPQPQSKAHPHTAKPTTNPTNISRGAKSRSSTPPASASLPARPPSGPSTSSSSRAPAPPTRGNANLPSRPSQLRSSTMGGNSLEEGELGGDEEGQVAERGVKRALDSDRASRSTRSRK